MTAKDLKIIADAVSSARSVSAPVTEYMSLDKQYDEGYSDAHEVAFGAIMNRLADRLAADNPRFDRDLFVAACK